MNRHQRRAAAKLSRPSLGSAVTKVEQALGQLQAVQGLADLPVVMDRVNGLLQDMSAEIATLQEEVRVREEVLPQLLAKLTNRSVEDVVAMQAELIAAAVQGSHGP